MSALKDLRNRNRMTIALNLSRVQPRGAIGNSQDCVPKPRPALPEHLFHIEHSRIERDKPVQIGGDDGNVVQSF
jgi:hypothetical protein